VVRLARASRNAKNFSFSSGSTFIGAVNEAMVGFLRVPFHGKGRYPIRGIGYAQ
jgi:hypothetical protein